MCVITDALPAVSSWQELIDMLSDAAHKWRCEQPHQALQKLGRVALIDQFEVRRWVSENDLDLAQRVITYSSWEQVPEALSDRNRRRAWLTRNETLSDEDLNAYLWRS